MEDEDQRRPRIVVVGPCAAGKTTLVAGLAAAYDIRSCAQEHSHVPDLWRRFSRADVLVFLDVGLPAIARRLGGSDWTPAILDEQRRRLADARAHCDFYLVTDGLTPQQVAAAVEGFLEQRGIFPRSQGPREDQAPG